MSSTVTLEEAVDLLRSLAPELPALLDRRWDELEPQVAKLLEALDAAPDDAARMAIVDDLVTLLGIHRSVRRRLAPVQYLLADTLDRDRGAVRVPRASDARPVMVERTPHLDVSAPDPLNVGDSVIVDVFLDTEGFAPGETGARVVLPDLPVLQLDVWLTTSSHFRVIGAETSIITVRSGEDKSSTATFTLEYLGAGEGEQAISAQFSYNGRGTGSVRRVLSAEAESAVGSFGIDPRAREADLVIRVSRHPSRDKQRFNVALAGTLLDGYEGATEGEWILDEDPREVVARYMRAFMTSTPIGRKAALRGAGKLLFRASPEIFQDAFWTLIGADEPLTSIFLQTEEPLIPWELMIPERDGVAREALGVEFAFGRWTHPAGVAPLQVAALDDSWVIAPAYDDDHALDFSDAEAQQVMAAFRGRRISPAYLQSIKAALAGEPATLVHFVGHGAADRGSDALVLESGDELTPIGLEGLDDVAHAIRAKHPMVFLNACEVGRQAPALSGLDGFPTVFAGFGASCVIAPIWSVEDGIAKEVARDFYEAIEENPSKPFAAILSEIRARSYKGDDPPDSYAAYCFYGDPLAAQQV